MIRTLFMLLVLLTAAPAFAAAVSVRASTHEGHGRLVFDWPAPTGFSVAKVPDGLEIDFTAPGTLGPISGSDPRIGAVSAIPGDRLRVHVSVPADATFQSFTVGGRVVIDIEGSDAIAPSRPAKAAAIPAAAPAPVPVKPGIPAKPVAATSAPVKPVAAAAPTLTSAPAPVAAPQPAPVAAAPPVADATVSLTMTEPTEMAAYVRDKQLWIVLDRPQASAAPVVTGKLPPFKRYDFANGTAFAAPFDDRREIYGEGGGLSWKLTLTSNARDAEPAAMQPGESGSSASWPLGTGTHVLSFPDPQVGDTLTVVTVVSADRFAGPKADTVDFTALRSAIGLAIAPKVDDLQIAATAAGLNVTRPNGLALSPARLSAMRMPPPPAPAQVQDVSKSSAPPSSAPLRHIYDFGRWAMSSPADAEKSIHELMAGVADKDRDGQVEDLLALARINLALDRGLEAQGFLDMAEDTLPALADSVEFKALRGAADALSSRFDEAATEFAVPELQPYTELNYWRAYVFASLEDWRQAKAVLPGDAGPIFTYPPTIADKMGMKLAEVDLHAGDTQDAAVILDMLDRNRDTAPPWVAAGLDYLGGELAMQQGDAERARRLWKPLVTGEDHLYRARAGLALTALELKTSEITPDKAIDRLEGLRFTWRGDELEARVNFMLGKLYIAQKKYLKGFDILRDAATMDPDSDIGKEIAAWMRDNFRSLLMTGHDVTPIDAAELYEEYPELIPPGNDGDVLGQRIAERLVTGDMLDRAAAILQKQVDTRLQGADKARVAMRLAAIDLLDKNPKAALPALQIAEQTFASGQATASKDDFRHAELMQARAMSQENRTQDALAMLAQFPPDPETNALRADIAWSAGLWDQAAAALQDMILDQITDPEAPLTQKQADLILNRAVALNLSGNRVALANLHSRYSDAMSKTSRGNLFEIVARPRESALLSDKQTLDQIVSEVDIFKDFLTSYQKAGVSQ